MNFKVTNEIATYAGYKNYIENMVESTKRNQTDEEKNALHETYKICLLNLEVLIMDCISKIVKNKRNIQQNMHDGRIAQDIIITEEICIKAFNDQIEFIKSKIFVFRKRKLLKKLEENIKKSNETIRHNKLLLKEYDEKISQYMKNEENLFNELAFLDDKYGEQQQ